MLTRRTLLRSTALVAAAVPAAAAVAAPPHRGEKDRLTNLSHLRFLLAEVPLPETEGHSTIDPSRPTGLAPWTYADREEDGSFTPVGGGDLDPTTGHWSQGAFNADDISRAAIVFLRAHAAFGEEADLATARDLLRTLTYLQVDSGELAGNVVLWQQSDGALNRSAVPVELPDPSDSDESYWLARTVWALGEGIAGFAECDPEFSAFLLERLHLALDALERASLSRYGQWEVADGVPVPGWLITGGADATGEAVLGLAAGASAVPKDPRIAEALARYAEGIDAMASGGVGVWPFGAVLPWSGSQSFWHAWGGLAPAALAAGWFFGANPAGEHAYDPATGVTVDGIEPDGLINRNAGAESTIHAQLTMIALDGEPKLARTARSLTSTPEYRGMQWLPAEEAQLSGAAQVMAPESAWTGESNWRDAYVLAEEGATVRLDLGEQALAAVADGGATAHPVFHRFAEDAGTATWTAIAADGTRTDLGTLELGGAGDPGITEWDGVLKPMPLEVPLPADAVALEAVSHGRLELDEVMLLPAVASAVFPSERDMLTLHVASADAELAVRPGQTGRAYRADGTSTGPITHGRRALQAGRFAVMR